MRIFYFSLATAFLIIWCLGQATGQTIPSSDDPLSHHAQGFPYEASIVLNSLQRTNAYLPESNPKKPMADAGEVIGTVGIVVGTIAAGYYFIDDSHEPAAAIVAGIGLSIGLPLMLISSSDSDSYSHRKRPFRTSGKYVVLQRHRHTVQLSPSSRTPLGAGLHYTF